MSGRDVFGCMPTGGGKSLTFQLPAVISEGVTIVIMPLISLISDQLSQMKNLGIRSEAFLQGLGIQKQRLIFDDIIVKHENRVKLIFCTPEKMNKSNFFFQNIKEIYEANMLERIVIDEAHCVSQWGHDFRSDYLGLSILRENFPKTPILALTATATESVRIDIIRQLRMSNKTLYFQSSFNRPNLFYQVKPKLTKKKVYKEITELITTKFFNQPGLIYCGSIKDTEEMSNELKKMGISVEHYHGKMNEKKRKTVQEKWTKGIIKVLSATIAFGMGINKPDVRFVIHYSFSKSIENYYQETGRAGRDGKPSHCILYYRISDRSFFEFFISKRQDSSKSFVKKSLWNLTEMIRYCSEDQLCRRKMLLEYFSEDFEEENCKGMCDICISNVFCKTRYKDCRKYVLSLEKLIFCAQLQTYKPSFNSLVDYLISKHPNAPKKKPNKSHYYLPEIPEIILTLTISEIEKLIREMIYRGIIEENFIITFRSGMVVLNPNRKAFNLFKNCKDETSIYISNKVQENSKQIKSKMSRIKSEKRQNILQNTQHLDIENSNIIKKEKRKKLKSLKNDYVNQSSERENKRLSLGKNLREINEKLDKSINLKDLMKIRALIFQTNKMSYKNVFEIISNKILYEIRDKPQMRFNEIINMIEEKEGIINREHLIFLKEYFKYIDIWNEEKSEFEIKMIEYGFIFDSDDEKEVKPKNESEFIFTNASKIVYDDKGYAMEMNDPVKRSSLKMHKKISKEKNNYLSKDLKKINK